MPWECSPDNPWWRPRTATYPASDRLMPGDVLLFVPRNPSIIESVIQRQQEHWGATSEHARFTHAALYIGLDHLICEAVPQGGIRYSTLDSRLDDFCWLARRWPGLTLVQGQRIASEAVFRLGKPYGWRSIIEGFLTRGKLLDDAAAERLVCSRLCDRAIVRALLGEGFSGAEVVFHPNAGALVTPATLSQTAKLMDIDLGWRRVSV